MRGYKQIYFSAPNINRKNFDFLTSLILCILLLAYNKFSYFRNFPCYLISLQNTITIWQNLKLLCSPAEPLISIDIPHLSFLFSISFRDRLISLLLYLCLRFASIHHIFYSWNSSQKLKNYRLFTYNYNHTHVL